MGGGGCTFVLFNNFLDSVVPSCGFCGRLNTMFTYLRRVTQKT